MTVRHAACSCGKLNLTVHGEPTRISVCHCLACQLRTGSAFGVLAIPVGAFADPTFPAPTVSIMTNPGVMIGSGYLKTSSEGADASLGYLLWR